MKLRQYLTDHDLTLTEFARLVGVTTEAVRRYVGGDRTPTPDVMRRIFDMTDGAVTANDFFDLSAPAPAPTDTAA